MAFDWRFSIEHLMVGHLNSSLYVQILLVPLATYLFTPNILATIIDYYLSK